MQLKKLSQSEYCARLGIELDSSGVLSAASMARLIRMAVARYRLTTTYDVRVYVDKQVQTAGADTTSSKELYGQVLSSLIEMEDVKSLRSDDRPLLAASELIWVRIAPNVGAFLGSAELPADVNVLRSLGAISDTYGMDSLVRRFDPSDPDTRAILYDLGAKELSLEQWCGVPDYAGHLKRRGQSSLSNLSLLWSAVCDALEKHGGPVSDPEALRVVGGKPNDLFGKCSTGAGRWGAGYEDGVWCGATRGYGETHWHPAVVRVQGQRPTHALHLYDWDEFNWALIARGLDVGPPELIPQSGDEVAFSIPAPKQLFRLMRLVAVRIGPWRWRLLPGVPKAPWRMLW